TTIEAGTTSMRVGVDPNAPVLLNQATATVRIGPPVAAALQPGGGPGRVIPTGPLVFVDPRTPVERLVPVRARPTDAELAPNWSDVAEVSFGTPVQKSDPRIVNVRARQVDRSAGEDIKQQIASIQHLNRKSTDAFMTALIESRLDLAGLPFVM